MLFFLIRHGDPIYNPDSLTPLGERQAEAVGKRLALYGVDKIFASTSKRAEQTAVPTCEMLKKEMTLLEWCREGNAWQQLTVVDEQGKRHWGFQDAATIKLFNSPELMAYGKEFYKHPHFEGTTFEEGIHRIGREADAFFASLGYVHEPENNRYRAESPTDERIALFAHQGFGLAFLSWLLDIPYPLFCTHFDMSHSGMTVIEFATQNGYAIPKVLTLANDSHLYREGLPTNYQNRLRF